MDLHRTRKVGMPTMACSVDLPVFTSPVGRHLRISQQINESPPKKNLGRQMKKILVIVVVCVICLCIRGQMLSPTNSITLDYSWFSTNHIYYIGSNLGHSVLNLSRTTNFFSTSNRAVLIFNSSYVIPVSSNEWHLLTNAYPNNVTTQNVSFYK